MARVCEPLLIPIRPEPAFDHVADFTTTANWDPGISAARRLDEGPLGVGSRFEVRLEVGMVSLPLIYEITTYDRPHRVVLESRGWLYEGVDDVTFAATDQGTLVTWNATFRLRGAGRAIDPLLLPGFRRTAAAAVAGLAGSLRTLADR